MSTRASRAAFVLSVIAGVLVIINSLWWVVEGKIFNDTAPGAIASVAVAGIVFGLIIIFGAWKVRSASSQQMTWGSVVVLFSGLSLVIVGGGFGLGFVLGVIGGALAISRSARVSPDTPG